MLLSRVSHLHDNCWRMGTRVFQNHESAALERALSGLLMYCRTHSHTKQRGRCLGCSVLAEHLTGRTLRQKLESVGTGLSDSGLLSPLTAPWPTIRRQDFWCTRSLVV